MSFDNSDESSSNFKYFDKNELLLVKRTADKLSSSWSSKGKEGNEGSDPYSRVFNGDRGERVNDIEVKDHVSFCEKNLKIKKIEKDTQNVLDSEVYETDDVVLKVSKHWVEAMIADFAVCPFTIDSESAGIPRGYVRYHISHARTFPEVRLYI